MIQQQQQQQQQQQAAPNLFPLAKESVNFVKRKFLGISEKNIKLP